MEYLEEEMKIKEIKKQIEEKGNWVLCGFLAGMVFFLTIMISHFLADLKNLKNMSIYNLQSSIDNTEDIRKEIVKLKVLTNDTRYLIKGLTLEIIK